MNSVNKNAISVGLKEVFDKNAKETAFLANKDIAINIFSYSQVEQLIKQSAVWLTNKNLAEKRRVLTLLPNSVETMVISLSLFCLGVDLSPLPCTTTASELKNWAEMTQPDFCIVSDLLDDACREYLRNSGIAWHQISTDQSFDWLPKKTEKNLDFPMGSVDSQLLLATSGTTGEPKAMVINVGRLWKSAKAFTHFHQLDEKAERLRFWNYLPMSYLGGLFNLGLIPLSIGGSILIDETFSGATFLKFWNTIETQNINALWLVPTISRGILSFANRLSQEQLEKLKNNIKNIFIGTAPILLSEKEKIEKLFGTPCLENFGLSETTFISSEQLENVHARSESSVGSVMPSVSIKLKPLASDPDFQELYVKTPFLFEGYIDRSGKVSLMLDEEGYFPTGDLAHLDDRGQLILDGRIKDVIKKGGYFMSLKELERIAGNHESILEVAAVGVPHDFYGESAELHIVLKETAPENSLALFTKWFHENLTKHKWPEKILLCKTLPKTASGKVRKHLLVEKK